MFFALSPIHFTKLDSLECFRRFCRTSTSREFHFFPDMMSKGVSQLQSKKKRPKLFLQVRHIEEWFGFEFERLKSLRSKIRTIFHFSVSSCLRHFSCFFWKSLVFCLQGSVYRNVSSEAANPNLRMFAAKISTRDLL